MTFLRTGSVGNRSAEDMVKTLVEPKKSVISRVREKLLSMGYNEEVEHDAINVEPVLIYSNSERTVFLRHKWELSASIPVESKQMEKKESLPELNMDLSKYLTKDEEERKWLKFELPNDPEALFLILGKM